MVGKIKKFANDVVSEMKKVSWPNRDQLRESTIIVLGFTVIITAFTWLVDQAMTRILQGLYSIF